MKRMKQIIALLLALSMSLGMLAGCGNADEPTESAESEAAETEAAGEETAKADAETVEENVLKLQWHQQAGIDTLFESPWKDMQSLLPFMIYDSLLVTNSDGTYSPKLAEDWTISEDGLTYTFTIREGVKWHDGVDFTAEDVVWSFNAYAASGGVPGSAAAAMIEGYADVAAGNADSITGITAEGNTVTVTLSSPSRFFMNGICNIKILPRHLLGEVAPMELATYEAYWSKPVGTGAYVLDEVSFPDYCTVIANADYYGEAPGIPKVLFTNYSAGGNDAVVAGLIAGDLDFAFGNAINDIEVASNITAQNPDVYAQMGTSYYSRYLVFNLGNRADGEVKEDLKNEKVRQAFNLIVDQNAIASFYGEQAVGLSTMVNPEDSAYNTDIPLPVKDIETAKAMLEEAGFDFSQTIDIAYYYDDQTTADIMALIKQDFALAGVNVETSLMTGDLGTQIYTDCNYDIIYLGMSYATPLEFYSEWTTKPWYTFMGMEEERGAIFDDLYAEYEATVDDATAKEIGDELQALGYQTCYILPCYGLNTIVIYNTTNISVPTDIFEVDYNSTRNWKFEEWTLNK